MVVQGRAAQYNVFSVTLDDGGPFRFREVLLPGCFDHALRRADVNVPVAVNHDRNQVLASFRDRPDDRARVWADRDGLFFETTLPESPLGRRTLAGLQNGALGGCSFQFRGATSQWIPTPGGLVRRIRDIGELSDVSLVRLGAYQVSAPDPAALAA